MQLFAYFRHLLLDNLTVNCICSSPWTGLKYTMLALDLDGKQAALAYCISGTVSFLVSVQQPQVTIRAK